MQKRDAQEWMETADRNGNEMKLVAVFHTVLIVGVYEIGVFQKSITGKH